MPFYVRGTALKNRLDALFKLIMGKIYDTNAPGYRRNDNWKSFLAYIYGQILLIP